MDRELASQIGGEARRARTALQLTQADAAERVGVSVEFSARIERGGTLPSVPTLQRLALSLGTSADALLGAPPRFTRKPAPTEAPVATQADRTRRRVIRRLQQADDATIRLVNQLLVGLAGLREGWLSSLRRRAR